MKISKAIEKKEQLEMDINKLIGTFESNTGLTVEKVYTRTESFSGCTPMFDSIKVTANKEIRVEVVI